MIKLNTQEIITMAKNTNEIEKIIVQENDELIDIIRKISSSDAGRIILTFTEHSDLLISPINLKVIQELCDEKDKILIAQIIQNRTGLLNAETAGITSTDSSSSIEDNLWIDALTDQKSRKKELRSNLKKVENDIEILDPETEISTNDKLEEIPNTTENKDNENSNVTKIDFNGYPTDKDILNKSADFKSRINNTLAKSKEEIKSGKNKIVTDGDFVMALDSDINEIAVKPKNPSIPSTFIGKSIKPSSLNSYKKMNLFSKQLPDLDDQNLHEEIPVEKKKIVNNDSKPKRVIFLLLKVFVPIIILLALAGYLMYTMLPLVRVKVFIESKSVASSIDFTGQNGSEFNLENKIIAVKTEEVIKERSDNAQTTGIAYRGDRSMGSVQIVCNLTYPTPLSLVSGTVLTHDGKNYYTQAAINETCPWNGSVTVQAEDIGEEYDLPSGSQFSISGYTLAEVSGTNSGEITGGTKTSYKALSAEDVTNAVNKLKQVTFDEATKELKETKAGSGWVMIENSIVNELDGEPNTDYIIGTETDIFNVSIKTKSRAIYYYRKDLDDLKEEILVETAKSQNLFSTSEGYNLKLSDEITSNITLVSLDNGIVTLKYDLTGSVKPDVNKEDINNYLQGKKWEEGLKYLKSLKFTSKEPVTTFTPDYFPEFLWYFPNSSSKIIIQIEEEKLSTSTPEVVE